MSLVAVLACIAVSSTPAVRTRPKGDPALCGCALSPPSTLDCSGLDLTEVPPPRCLPGNVTTLDLSHNSIYALENDSFASLTLLAVVELTDNRLLSIPDGAFAAQRAEAARLVFRRNRLTAVGPGAFAGCTRLLYLDLTANDLVAVTLSNLPLLSGLDLNSNALRGLPSGSITGCPALAALDLSANFLTAIDPNAVNGPTNLSFVAVGGNLLSPHAAASAVATFAAVSACGLTTVDLGGSPTLGPGALPLPPPNATRTLHKLVANNCSLSSVDFERLPATLRTLELAGNTLQTLVDPFPALPVLEVLVLAGNALTAAPSAALALPSLVRLDLSGNPIGHLSSGTLRALPSLQVLDLQGCALTRIDAGAFDGLANLTELFLSNNRLTVGGLPMGVFARLRALVVFQLTAAGPALGGKGAVWSDGCANMTGLETVALGSTGQTGASLVAFPWERLTALQNVDVSGNPLVTVVPASLAGLSSLSALYLRGTRLAPGVALPPSVATVDLCDGAADQINLTEALATAPGLLTVNVCNGTARRSAAAPLLPLPRLSSLLRVAITSAGLTSVNARAWSGAQGIETLALDGNPGLALEGPAPFGSLPKLRTLTLSSCGLTTFSAEAHLAGLTGLGALDLSSNRLTEVALDPLPPADALRTLVLRDNLLEAVPAVPSATLLAVLDLASNRVKALTAVCCGALVALLLPSNAITSVVPGALHGAPALEVIDLSDNLLTEVQSGALAPADGNTSRLTTLLLGGNALRGVPPDLSAAAAAAALRVVELSGNQITRLGAAVFGGATRLETLAVADNGLSVLHPRALDGATRLQRLCLWRNAGTGPLPSGLLEGNTGLTAVDAFLSGWQSLPAVQSSPLGYLKAVSLQGAPPLGELPAPLAALSNPLLRVTMTAPAEVAAGCGPARYDVALAAIGSTAVPPAVVTLPVELAAWWSRRGFDCVCDPDGPGTCACTACAPGHRASPESGGCSVCPAGGFFQDEPAAVNCKRCPVGAFVPAPGGGASLADCQPCPEGTNTSVAVGVDGCPCLAGYARPANRSNFTRCEHVGAAQAAASHLSR